MSSEEIIEDESPAEESQEANREETDEAHDAAPAPAGEVTPDEPGAPTPEEPSEPARSREPRERPPRREYSDYRKPRETKPEANTFDVSKSADAPRRVHNTRVAFTFECAGCKKEATLDYKPKGVPVDELLCEECMSAQENAGRW